jgi:hypothetical protein
MAESFVAEQPGWPVLRRPEFSLRLASPVSVQQALVALAVFAWACSPE